MSVFCLVCSLVLLSIIIGVFLWIPCVLFIGLVLGLIALLGLLRDVVFGFRDRYVFAFILFVFSEAMVFFTLFVGVLWFEDSKALAISGWFDIPFTGCFLLISSSFAATLFHSAFAPGCEISRFFLGISILYGIGFVFLQFYELWNCCCDLTYCAYYASSLCTVSLHFVHVFVGLIGLCYLYAKSDVVGNYHVDLVVWYWHFVDYIWLLVYFVVYLL